MNHQKIYDAIIEKAKSENRIRFKKKDATYVYYEDHHIIPRCLNGNNEKENKFLLTAREHYICHKLLTYIYKGNRKIVYAFHRMTYCKNGNHIKSARDYSYAIELIRTTPVSEETRQKRSKSLKGKKRSDEQNKKNRERNLGEKNPMYKKSSYDIWIEKYGKDIADKKEVEKNKKIGESNKGKIVSKESKNKK